MPYVPSYVHSLFRPTTPLSDSKFTLGIAGVAGFLGASDEADPAMAIADIYHKRKWLGWYNSPGSYHVAQRYKQLAKSRSFKSPDPSLSLNNGLATFFELDGRKGPKYNGAKTGSIIPETGHLAAMMERECDKTESIIKIMGRVTQPVEVTIVNLGYIPGAIQELNHSGNSTNVFAFIPISVSIGTCIACAVFQDWYSFSMILLGIFASGISCLLIGYGLLKFHHPEPPKGSPQGDGFLLTDSNVIILKGDEGAVNSITRGKFSVNFGSKRADRYFRMCSGFLTVQFVVQLLLVPQGTLFGQIMFATSLAVSWGYNSWLSSIDKEEIQGRILLDILQHPTMTKYTLGTRTTMAVFVLLVLKPLYPEKVLDDILPNDMDAWKVWKKIILSRIKNGERMHFNSADWDNGSVNEKERPLLETLLGDAQAAYDGYCKYFED